ncbi:uncharacterized protein LOC122644890 [Telopea speciosissima]|uniref:uncharacterized protein LOC122644890 n=1 Tax=Telopea speciosissima TaxID=54955 RepID=UPI001CC51C65|nr:uncharacterized protein LOC122644890 [Telopea speciosissima]
MEFLTLSQGSKFVLDYQQAFKDLFYFAPDHMKVEDVKARKSERGLRHSISTSVVLHKYPTYAEVVQAAKVIEDQQWENYRAVQAGKRPMGSFGFKGPGKFQRGSYSTTSPTQYHKPDAAQAPKTAAAPHYGTQTLMCYNCNEVGHMIRDCPHARQGNSWPIVSSKAPQAKITIHPPLPSTANKTQGRVYSVTNEEAYVDPGMISICSQPAYVLFDLGATHSFVSPSFAKKIPIKPKLMAKNLMVGTPTGANLVYAETKIQFKPKGGIEFTFKGIKRERPKKAIISALQVHKLLDEGCQCYLAFVVDTEAKIKPMDEISVVRDFLDIFPEDLTRLPPNCETEFMINLVPGAAPVSKAPYRMASMEFEELQEQLRDLL